MALRANLIPLRVRLAVVKLLPTTLRALPLPRGDLSDDLARHFCEAGRVSTDFSSDLFPPPTVVGGSSPFEVKGVGDLVKHHVFQKLGVNLLFVVHEVSR